MNILKWIFGKKDIGMPGYFFPADPSSLKETKEVFDPYFTDNKFEAITEAIEKIVASKHLLQVPEGKHAARIEECNEVVLGPILMELITKVTNQR